MVKLESIDGGRGGRPKSPPKRSNANDVLHECPICEAAGEPVACKEVMIKYPAPRTDGNRIDLTGRKHFEKMYCPACLQRGRSGLFGEVGLIATYEKGQGWVLIRPDQMLKSV